MRFTLTHIQDHANEIFHRLRWNSGKDFLCPHCNSTHITSIDINHHHCNTCNRSFSDTSNTIFHSTKLPLWKWLTAIYYFLESPHGISSYTLSKYIGVSQPTAWRMQMLLRTHLRQQINLSNEVILDEVYLGAEWRFQPTYKKIKRIQSMVINTKLESLPLTKTQLRKFNYQAASLDKMIVLGFRDLKARKLELIHLHTVTGDNVLKLLKMRDNGITRIITDHSRLYMNFPYPHSICDHGKGQYKSVDGYSSNPIENHFTHLRRAWHGVYHWYSKKYVQGYLDEFSFKYNHRTLSIKEKFNAAFLLIMSNCLLSI